MFMDWCRNVLPYCFSFELSFLEKACLQKSKENKQTKHRLSILGLHFPHLDRICTTTTALTNFRLSLAY